MLGQQSWMSGPGKNVDDYSQLLKEEGFELVGAKINDWTFDWTDEVAKGFIESYALKEGIMKRIPKNLHKEFLRDMTNITQIAFQTYQCLWIAAKKVDNAPRETI